MRLVSEISTLVLLAISIYTGGMEIRKRRHLMTAAAFCNDNEVLVQDLVTQEDLSFFFPEKTPASVSCLGKVVNPVMT